MESKSASEGKAQDRAGEAAEQLERICVVENENRRAKAISHFPKEVRQVCKDIAAFFEAEAPGPKPRAVAGVPGPEALRMLLAHVDEAPGRDDDARAVWFYEYKLLGAEAIEELGLVDGLVPFAENVEGDFLAAGEDDHKGGVFCVSEGEASGEPEARSLATYLERYRDALLSHQLEYVEDCGMVEATCKSPTAPAATSGSKK